MAKVFLTVQRVGGEQHTRHPEFLDQGLDGGDLVALGDLLVGEVSAASLLKALSSWAAAWSSR